jgi:hypothetical protein
MSLESFAEGVWIAHAPQKLLGLQLGTRMTVVELRDGSSLIHSPIPIDRELKAEIDALGPVAHIVAPSLFHHLYAADAKRAFPQAMLHGPEGLRKKRPDLRLDAILGKDRTPWRDEIDMLEIKGTLFDETVLLHRRSRTLICADLVENFHAVDDRWTRLYLKAGGVYGTTGLARPLRLAYRNRNQARRDIDRLLAWDFDRVVLAHGDPITSQATDLLREAYGWLEG